MDSRPRRGSALSRSTYIYDVRPLVLDEFCRIMDTCESPMGWRDLAKHMISDMTEMRLLALKGEHGKSCTAELIWTWGQRNHTVGELLDLLEVIGNKRALNLFLREIKMTMSPPSLGAPESLPPPPLALLDPVKVPYCPNVSPVSHVHAEPALCQAQPSDSEPKELNVPNVLDGAGLPLPGQPPGDTFCPISPGSANCSDNLQPSSSDSSGSGSSSSSSSNITSDNMGGSLRNLKEDKCSNLDSEVDSSCKATMESISSQDSLSDNNAAVLDLQQIFSLQAILEGTHNFSIDRKLGEGAFGVVYKADIHRTPFAVKLLKKQGGIQWQTVLESLHAEMKHLYMLRHPNVLELAGFCLEQDNCCLVYHFMPNGSLEDRLHRGKGDGPLLWRTRLEIAEGAARGLQYLHTAQKDPVIHGDIKSANILLDSHCQAKLGDFGIARMGPFLGVRSYTYVRSAEMRGTLAYLPDEYVRSRQLSTKVDSYSFGVVLLELLTGRKAVQEQPQPQFLKDEVEDALDSDEVGTVSERMFDRSAGPYPRSQATDVLRLACKCLDKRKKRPEMTEVLEFLEAMRQTDAEETRPLALPSDAAPTPLDHRGALPLEPAGPRQVPVESTDVHQFPTLPQDLRSRSPVTAATSGAWLPLPPPPSSPSCRGREPSWWGGGGAASLADDAGKLLLRAPCESDDLCSAGAGSGGRAEAAPFALSLAMESVHVGGGGGGGGAGGPDVKPRGVARSFEAGREFAARMMESGGGGGEDALLCHRGLPPQPTSGRSEHAGTAKSMARPGHYEAASLSLRGAENCWARRVDGPMSLPPPPHSSSTSSANASQGSRAALPEPTGMWLNSARRRMEERINQYNEGHITSAELFSETEGTNRVPTEDLESRTGNR
ncbi:interleukin-1 receptor-associated kinase 3-like isoform X2 [Petromyzon marinus]|uniref:interleukin-1 receptor-associated kinase 3-like isoform X2 n=1 Tax=Petromyzon marinus TaxID=7757 RepID=UPI003F6EF6AE